MRVLITSDIHSVRVYIQILNLHNKSHCETENIADVMAAWKLLTTETFIFRRGTRVWIQHFNSNGAHSSAVPNFFSRADYHFYKKNYIRLTN